MWSIYLKTPAFGRTMWFPMLGIESRIMTVLDTGDDDDADIVVDNHQTWNNFWYRFGIGLDREITNKVFARMEFLLGFRGNNQYENILKNTNDSSVDGIPVSISIKLMIYYNIQ